MSDTAKGKRPSPQYTKLVSAFGVACESYGEQSTEGRPTDRATNRATDAERELLSAIADLEARAAADETVRWSAWLRMWADVGAAYEHTIAMLHLGLRGIDRDGEACVVAPTPSEPSMMPDAVDRVIEQAVDAALGEVRRQGGADYLLTEARGLGVRYGQGMLASLRRLGTPTPSEPGGVPAFPAWHVAPLAGGSDAADHERGFTAATTASGGWQAVITGTAPTEPDARRIVEEIHARVTAPPAAIDPARLAEAYQDIAAQHIRVLCAPWERINEHTREAAVDCMRRALASCSVATTSAAPASPVPTGVDPLAIRRAVERYANDDDYMADDLTRDLIELADGSVPAPTGEPVACDALTLAREFHDDLAARSAGLDGVRRLWVHLDASTQGRWHASMADTLSRLGAAPIAPVPAVEPTCSVCDKPGKNSTHADTDSGRVTLRHCGGRECWSRVHRAIDVLRGDAPAVEPAGVLAGGAAEWRNSVDGASTGESCAEMGRLLLHAWRSGSWMVTLADHGRIGGGAAFDVDDAKAAAIAFALSLNGARVVKVLSVEAIAAAMGAGTYPSADTVFAALASRGPVAVRQGEASVDRVTLADAIRGAFSAGRRSVHLGMRLDAVNAEEARLVVEAVKRIAAPKDGER